MEILIYALARAIDTKFILPPRISQKTNQNKTKTP